MAITKIQSGAFPADVITSSAIDDLSVTHAKLHTTMDLSSKTVTLPTLNQSLTLDGPDAGVAKLRLQAEEVHGDIEGINIGNNFGGLAFKTNNNGTVAERVRIDNAGNVGIGTSSIASNTKLIVKAATDQNFEVEYTSGKLRLSALNDARSANVPLQFASTSFEFLSGNVGIGETSPLGKLHVKTADSGATADASADEFVIEGSGNSGMSILSGASNTGSIYFGDSGTNWDGYIAYSHNDRKMTFGTAAGGGSVNIDSSGNVGIGAASPTEKLHVAGTVKATGGLYDTLTVNSGSNPFTVGGVPKLAVKASTGDVGITIGTANTDLMYIRNQSGGGEFCFQTSINGGNDGEIQLQPYGGNVGIGTANPAEKLHVEGSIRASGNIGVTQPDGDYLAKLYQSAADGFLELFTGDATPVSRIKLSSYGSSYINPVGTTAANQAVLSVGAEAGAKSGVFNIRSTNANVGGYRHRMAGGTDYKNVCSFHTGANTIPYWHIRTNIVYSNNVMFVARVHGYAYGNAGHIIDVSRSGYAYSGSNASVIASQLSNNGSVSVSLDTYYTAAGELCFRCYYTGSYYTGLAFDIKMQSPTGYNHDFAVLDQNTNNTSGNYFT